eukprot:CAMPEP_0175144194 /NCGR_PEP_ID=MMETSP0087-20121206/13971_1 /TAXON_ID=136419 /ORGANISM="Unknown Unknown, Strain D1" /LENGTH=76 /DNA_ID=CAMNT_0016428585 /DNA_START=640 /DNA_END=870 /DNA_ORIENTATION=+
MTLMIHPINVETLAVEVSGYVFIPSNVFAVAMTKEDDSNRFMNKPGSRVNPQPLFVGKILWKDRLRRKADDFGGMG